MGLELRQQLKLSQQLVMTPQLQQAIKLLQLSRLELVNTIQQEMLENPFLEESYSDTDAEDYAERPKEADDNVYADELAQNADWEDYLGDFSSTTRQAAVRQTDLSEEEGSSIENYYSTAPSLEGHLTWQLRLSSLTEKEMGTGTVIIGNIGPTGYLQASVEEISNMAEASSEEVEKVLKAIQHFDPVGVASRNVLECLMVQLEVLKYDRDPILVSLIKDHLEDLESHRYKPIMRKFKLTEEDLREYLDVIQTLEPMPGKGYGDVEPSYVEPDVYIYAYEGDFIIALNDDGLPQLQLSSLYSDNLASAGGPHKEYFQEKFRSASWLIKSLHQRQRTLYKVMESIVKHQRDFFEYGPSRLRPLILREIAEDVEMHESTISRVTSNKYAATPHGIYELKFFFNSSLALDDGSEVGSESVKLLIKKYLNEEDPKSPLSDERIVDMLKEELKVTIARRTVAKYRMAMGIDSSSKRRVIF